MVVVSYCLGKHWPNLLLLLIAAVMLGAHVCLIKRKYSYLVITSLRPEEMSPCSGFWNSQSHSFDKWKKWKQLAMSKQKSSLFQYRLIQTGLNNFFSHKYLRLLCINRWFWACWLLTVSTASSQACFGFTWQQFPAASLWLLLCGHFNALFQRGAGSENSLYSDDSLISCFLAFVVFTNRDVCPDSH